MFQTDDILRRGMARCVDNDKWLVLVYLGTAVCGAFETALLYHPCGGDLNHVSNYVVRNLVVRAVVCLGYGYYLLKVLLAYHRIAEEAPRTTNLLRVR